MTEDQKIEIAVFRFGVIGEFVTGAQLDYGEKERLLQDKCARKWMIPHSNRTRLSKSTLLGWIRQYNGKFESLYPKERSDQGKARVLDDDTISLILKLRIDNPNATVHTLIESLEKITGKKHHYSSVYRLLRYRGLINSSAPEDRRKFEAPNPNDLWQSDVMHGPQILYQDKMRKTYLIAVIDDHSRLITSAGFYLSENLKTYLMVLEQAFLNRGLPRKLYVDNGPAFRSHHLKYVAASLSIALIHARPYKPQGKGKIERWFRTVRLSFLQKFSGKTLEDLNTDFEKWLNTDYHQNKHSSTGQTPFKRFTSAMECIRVAPPDLKDHFRKTARRKVAKDRTITLNGSMFEAPVALIGKHVDVKYHEETPKKAEVLYKNKSYGFLTPVDLSVNCRVKRDKWRNDIHIFPEASDYKGGQLL
ncbi:MAG: DDE-type integrase/transposase/recombinase [Desulfobacteraceae bacterium]|nr:DDE-type integrase/transposase/recombinase [Desulfobacteraceae bacterium]